MGETAAMPRLWLVNSQEERVYGGNDGYPEDPLRGYVWNSRVPHGSEVAKGDFVAIRVGDEVVGVARIARMTSKQGTAQKKSCPDCGNTNLKKRKTKEGLRCDKGHVILRPKVENLPATLYEAFYDGKFLPADPAVPFAAMLEDKSQFENYNSRHSIKLLAVERLVGPAKALGTLLRKLEGTPALQPALAPDQASGEPESDYEPSGQDEREAIQRAIKARRGQKKFRDKLIARYQSRCVVSRCSLVDALEAAHIVPYRSENDNNAANGLLLRADLHTLFDLDMLAIEPESFTVHVHPRARLGGYEVLHGAVAQFDGAAPSKAALRARWALFVGQPSMAAAGVKTEPPPLGNG